MNQIEPRERRHAADRQKDEKTDGWKTVRQTDLERQHSGALIISVVRGEPN